ncbi:MAG: hypothetical protein H0X25_22990, partial [Acidobacteriales bacterium]|nr:hypothetical protein [Terriglobales bacterium]
MFESVEGGGSTHIADMNGDGIPDLVFPSGDPNGMSSVDCPPLVHLTGTMKTLGVLVLSSMMGWLAQLGGFGLILMGLADNSVVPMPGSMD